MDELVKNLQIRKIETEDASDIGNIQAAITKSPTNIDFRQIIEDQVRKDEDVSFVAEIDGRVVGYMISYIVFGGFGLEKGAWIATLGVDPKFMGQGIGKRLAEETLFAGIQWTCCLFLRHWVSTGAILLILGKSWILDCRSRHDVWSFVMHRKITSAT